MNSVQRISAVVLRHWYLISHSLPRILELGYWPLVQIVLWGFIQKFIMTQSSYFAMAGGLLLGAVMLWDLLFRSQISLAISFFEEIYSRNLSHLLISPLRMWEYVVALMTVSIMRTLIGLVPVTFLAIWFFGFSIYSLGLSLALFFVSLVTFGWSVGLAVAGLVLRFGLGAESLTWALIFALAPLCGIYYPVTILPNWLQGLSAILPPSYIFEGMRMILLEQTVRLDLLAMAGVLNVVWLSAGIAVFFALYRSARIRGVIMQLGE